MDNIFEGFEFCGAWYKNMKIDYSNKEFDVDVQINGYDEEDNEEYPDYSERALFLFKSGNLVV